MTSSADAFYAASQAEQNAILTSKKNGGNRGYTRNPAIYIRHYRRQLTRAALSCFKWEGIGNHIESPFVEKTLFEYGKGIFFVQLPGEVSEAGDAMEVTEPRLTFRRVNQQGDLNDQWQMTRWQTQQPYGNGRMLKTVGDLETWSGIPVWDNQEKESWLKETIEFYANRLAEAAITVDVNLDNSRTQKVALITQDQVKAANMVDDSLKRGNGTIFLPKNATTGASIADSFHVMDFSIHPDVSEKNHVVFHRLQGEAYSAIGVKAQFNEKQAQQTEVEIEAPDSMVQSVRISRFDARRRAADLLNKRYGLSVQVHDTGTGE